MNRKKSIDEFEALFEQASIPVLDIPALAINPISIVLEDESLDPSIVSVAQYLMNRFGLSIQVHATDARAGFALELGQTMGFEWKGMPYGQSETLAEQVDRASSRMVMLGRTGGDSVISLDSFVESVHVPILILNRPIRKPDTLFGHILHSLTGRFEQERDFSISFHLAERAADVTVIHTVSSDQIDDVRQTLRVSSQVSAEEQEEVLGHLTVHGERYLKAVVHAARELPCHVTYRIEVGTALEVIEQQLSEGDYSLLVVGAHREGRSHIEAEVYQLMHRVTASAVLAL